MTRESLARAERLVDRAAHDGVTKRKAPGIGDRMHELTLGEGVERRQRRNLVQRRHASREVEGMTRAGDVFENPATRETGRIITGADETDGRYMRSETRLRP